jgi:putative adenylate-forming enzyme
MRLAAGVKFLAAYSRARRYDHVAERSELETLQQRWLGELRKDLARSSAFYRPYATAAWEDWPIVDKSLWMQNFDRINTVGARLDQVSAIALQAERTRDFSMNWGRHTVGMSTGTSGNRGVFLVSPEEGAQWAGTLLGKLLRTGLFARERIALVLRAGATLYDAIGALRLQFKFFDQARPWHEMAEDLRKFDPTILIAPASALRLLSSVTGTLRPRRVISVAEVLDDLDRQHIERGFAVQVEQIYQATEGLLGMSCEHGTVHLNEPYLIIEREWLDREQTRFTPIVTDLWRRAQPVVRYRLNDVLQVMKRRCPCGRAAIALAAIEGRSDDVLWLDGARDAVPVFPDLLSRAIVGALSEVEDFRVIEQSRGNWRIQLRPLPSEDAKVQLFEQLAAVVTGLGASPPLLTISELAVSPRAGKQRRVLGMKSRTCAS